MPAGRTIGIRRLAGTRINGGGEKCAKGATFAEGPRVPARLGASDAPVPGTVHELAPLFLATETDSCSLGARVSI